MPASDVEVPNKLSLFDAMEIVDGLTIDTLAERTGLDTNTVRRAVMGGAVRTNISTACRIAEVLETKVEHLLWPSGLTKVGRPALTGRPITHHGTSCGSDMPQVLQGDPSQEHEAQDPAVKERTPRHQPVESTIFCSEHHLLLPLTGKCDECAA